MVRVVRATPVELENAVTALRDGELVAFPTETVYGLGANAQNPAAVRRIFELKERPADHPVIVHLDNPKYLHRWARDVPENARKLAARFWPGPLTLVVAKNPALPEQISALPTVGVRMPDHDFARRLLELTGPMAVTSANRSGELSALTATGALEQLSGRIELILDGGRVPGGVPSTVVDCTGAAPVVLREGPVSAAEIEAALTLPV
jgi:L-threonylcarbamoyladenylate synthase